MVRQLALAYGLVSYLLFLASFLYAIGFVGNVLVPKSIDLPVVEASWYQSLAVTTALLLLFAVPHSVMARPAFTTWWTKIVPPEVIILWQPSTRTAAAYAPRLDEPDSNQAIKLEFDATEPLAPFVDRETNSRFGVEGRAMSGELKGKALTWIDSVQCRWFAWSAEYPDTSIAKPTRSAELKPGGAKRAALTDKRTEILLVEPDSVTSKSLDAWRAEGFTAVAALLDEDHPADAYRSAASAAHSAGVDLTIGSRWPAMRN